MTPEIVALAEEVPEHILVDDEPLCGDVLDEADARVVEADRDPVADASLHLCPECRDEWARIEDDMDREPTVRCVADRADDGDLWKCAEVVPASRARALKHPRADEPLPVCPECYEWIRQNGANGVSTPFEDAPSWKSRLEQ